MSKRQTTAWVYMTVIMVMGYFIPIPRSVGASLAPLLWVVPLFLYDAKDSHRHNKWLPIVVFLLSPLRRAIVMPFLVFFSVRDGCVLSNVLISSLLFAAAATESWLVLRLRRKKTRRMMIAIVCLAIFASLGIIPLFDSLGFYNLKP